MTQADRPLRIGIDARSQAATGGVQQFTLSLLVGLGRIKGTDEEYLALSNPHDQGWMAGAVGGQVRTLAVRQSMARRGRLGEVLRATSARFPILRRARAGLRRTVGPPDALPRSDGAMEAAAVHVAHFVRQRAFLTEIPSLYHPWDLQHVHLPEFFTDQERRFRDLAYRTFASRAAWVVAATTWAKEDLVATYSLAPETILVIPVAVDPDAYPVPSKDQLAEVRVRFGLPDRFLLYPAQTWQHKNHIRLMEAVAIARDRHQERVELVCTGHPNDHYARIEETVRRLRLEDRVHFTGYLSAPDLQAMYRLATGVVFPSLFEGWGIPIVEAFLAGAPVASSTATSLPALVADAARLFDPYDPDQIAEGMLALWTDPQLCERLVARGRSRVAQFDPDTIARTYRAAYRQVGGRPLTDDDRGLLAAPPLV
ncbi:MAG: glycosyltransferase family 1 protein [Chloroflexota bacterium]